MGRFGVELLLVFFASVTALGFIITYIISVKLGHVSPYLPYISDTGGKPPESCVFSFVCNIAILFELLIVYIRFKHIHTFYVSDVRIVCVPLKYINIVSFIVGLLSAFGFLLVANFQNDYVPSVHFIGAFVVFFAGLIYQWMQTYISFRIHLSGLGDRGLKKWMFLQLVICLLSLLFFFGAVLFAVLAATHKKHDNGDEQGTFHWTSNQGGFAFHVISTACEWAMSFTLLVFFITFHHDFKLIQLSITVHRRSAEVNATTYQSINETTPLNL